MVKWGYVDSSNQVTEVYEALPENWRNISNFYTYIDTPEILPTLGWYPVVDVTQPLDPLTEIYGNTEYIFEQNQQCILQNVLILPSPNPVTPEQWFEEQRQAFLQQLDTLRVQKLLDSDWTQLNDVQSEHDDTWRQEWKSYRGQIRNIVVTYSNPPYQGVIDINQVIWPLPPLS